MAGLNLTRKRILVVDDFWETRVSLRRMMQSFGATDIDMAANGEDAIKQLQKNSYEVILCDYYLGEGKDGQQVLEEAKHKSLIGFSTIFVMITAENTLQMVMGAIEYQPDEYVTKPFTKEQLKRRLERLAQRKADMESIERMAQRKDYVRAIDQCDKQLKEEPRNALEIMKFKAELCLSAANYEKAYETYEQILAVREIPWARLGIGKVLYLTRRYEEAKEIFHDLINQNNMYVEPYDWLAKCHDALGELSNAQQVLSSASEISPRGVNRQRALGEAALRNDDVETAEKALKLAVKRGKFSVHKNIASYTQLAKVMTTRKGGNDALRVLKDAREDFRGDPQAILQTALSEGNVFKTLNRLEDAKSSFNEAMKHYDTLEGKIATEVSVELARAAMSFGGDKKQAIDLVRHVVRNNHDNDKIIGQVQDLFQEAGMEEEGQSIIEACRNEVVQMNNQGVQLVKQGKLEEAIDFFRKAIEGIPDNKVVNLNGAQVLLMYMEKNGKNEEYLFEASKYLDTVRNIDPLDESYRRLTAMYEQMATSGDAPPVE